MLIIISDLHLVDGTCGKSISSNAFALFADRLEELAYNASWRSDRTYRPIDSVDILLLGDILDPQHSTLWLDKDLGDPDHVRPWSDIHAPQFAGKMREITRAILERNADSVAILHALSQNKSIRLPPATRRGQPAKIALDRVQVPVRIHYMVGNHDWQYHIASPAFDEIRQDVVNAIGLANPVTAFPHLMHESNAITELLAGYKIQAQHGDIHDKFNYRQDVGRDAAVLGDAFAIQVLNRFPVEVEHRLGDALPPGLIGNLHELVNVRPVLATPLWISGQLRQNNIEENLQKELKKIWDELAEEFLELDFVRQFDKRFKVDVVDGLELLTKLTKRASFKTIDEIVVWMREKMGTGDISFAKNALKEEAFIKRTAQYIVYGHTHHHEIVPLDLIPATPRPTNQMYLNSGTWHTFYDLAVYKPEEHKFIPYQVLTYLAFYRGDECSGRHFEAWSGAFAE